MVDKKASLLFQEYIHVSRYARFLWDEKRRETWAETVTRYVNFLKNRFKNEIDVNSELWTKIYNNIYEHKVMPSMRALMTAGPALERDNLCAFNCAFILIDSPRAFDEILYVLLAGTGVGFSVEQKHVEQLPVVADEFFESDTIITVGDSKLGWAKAYKEVIHLLYGGQIPKIDFSKVRPHGAPLKTFGGRASGPEPLSDLISFTINLFKNAAGRKLTTLEAHDLVCKISTIVVVGGVRRAALISLSDLNDDLLRIAKSGQWYVDHSHRALANNSWVAKNKPEIGIFMKEWLSLYESKSGERGIFSRYAANNKVLENGRRKLDPNFGFNPCGEIILRPSELCNLSEVIVNPYDTEKELSEKIQIATILGTLQSALTDFKYVNKKWKQNCEEERLLGVSLSGIMDNVLLNGNKKHSEDLPLLLKRLKQVAIDTNKEYANILKINQSVAISCVKPSGTSSSLNGCSAGIHPAYAPFYIRRVRNDKKDPLSKFLRDQGVPCEDDVMSKEFTDVFSFPIQAPYDSVFRNDMSAIQQLEHWLIFKENWCEHNPSITVTVREHEWLDVGAWVYKHLDKLTGVSFLPHSDMVYKQAPYEEITPEEYRNLVAKFPKTIDWTLLKNYEDYDQTTGSQELACSAGGCEIN